jgi:hypothetical protein
MESTALWRKFDGLWKENLEFIKTNLDQEIPGKMSSGVRNDNGFRMEFKESSMSNNGKFCEKLFVKIEMKIDGDLE